MATLKLNGHDVTLTRTEHVSRGGNRLYDGLVNVKVDGKAAKVVLKVYVSEGDETENIAPVNVVANPVPPKVRKSKATAPTPTPTPTNPKLEAIKALFPDKDPAALALLFGA